MLNFKSYLEEGRDAPLYHATEYGSIISILQSNTIKGNTEQTPEFKSKKKYVKDKWGTIYGISLTRNIRFAHEWLNGLMGSGAILELDQRKLAQNYKIIAYNFHSYDGARQGNHELGLGHDSDHGDMHPYNQSEEFIVGSVKNVDKYLKKIIVIDDKWKKNETLKNHPLIWDLKIKRFVNQ
jgi:hypothetical protein